MTVPEVQVNEVTITAPKILGQLTATDDDLRTTLKYEAVGAPVEGLVIDKDTGAWSFDPSNEAYQYLKKTKHLLFKLIIRQQMKKEHPIQILSRSHLPVRMIYLN